MKFLYLCLIPLSQVVADGFVKVCDEPLVYVCDRFLKDQDCDHLIALGAPSLKRSTVVNPDGAVSLIDSRRTSLGMFLPFFTQDEVVLNIHRRIAEVTSIPEENGESMQILYYGEGAEYRPHYDYFDPKTPGGLFHYRRGGQRVASFIIYLNTPEAGGETVFPRVHLKITPEKGKALLFYNVDAMGAEDPMSFHGGAPVLKGEKWIITRWLRESTFY